MNSEALTGPPAAKPAHAPLSGAAGRLAILLGAAALPGTLLAQLSIQPASREEGYAQQQAEKAAASEPPKPARAEEIMRKVETLFLLDPSGFFPAFESVYQGGGLTVGGG